MKENSEENFKKTFLAAGLIILLLILLKFLGGADTSKKRVASQEIERKFRRKF